MLEHLPDSIGHALLNQRAGMESVVYNQLHAERVTPRLSVQSSFAFNARLPEKFTADGSGTSPPLSWENAPPGTESFAIIVEDADSPTPHPLVHLIVVDIAAGQHSLSEGALESPDHAGVGPEAGRNSYLQHAWLPPDPPPGHGEHRYVFQVFALRQGKPFSKSPGRGEFIERVLERAIAVGALIGTYEREPRTVSTEDVVALGEASPA